VSNGLEISRSRVRISRKGVAAIRVKCRSKSTCTGRLKLYRLVIKPGSSTARRITVGTKRFKIGGGRKASVRVPIRAAERRRARRNGRLKVVAAATAVFAAGGKGKASAPITLLPARRR
jgi:hypothetical protein